MILSPVLFLPLLGAATAVLPQEPEPERAPYVAYLEDVHEAEPDVLRDALARVPGVARVVLDAGSGRVELHAKDEAYVARVHVEKALGSGDVALAGFDEPSWSKVMVYVVTTIGGG